MPVQATFDAPIPFDGAPALGIQELANSIRYRGPNAEQVALGFEQIENTFSQLIEALTSTVDGIFSELTVVTPDGEVIGWVGDRDGYSGGWFKNLYVGGSDPSTAPLVADVNGRVTLVVGDSDDQGYFSVLDGSGNVVVWAGKTGTDYGLYAQNLWIGGTGPADAPFFSNGTGTYIGDNGFIKFLDKDGAENGWIGARTISAIDYAGGWVREWRIGGDGTDSAVIIADRNGDVSIAGGDVYIGPGATGLGGRIFVYTGSTLTGWVGSGDIASPVAVTSISGGTVTTGAAHGLAVGNYAFLNGTNNAAHNNRIVQVATAPTATTYTVTGLTGSSTGGTSTKQQTGAWFQEIRAGGSGPATAKLVGSSSGLSITDATISISGASGGVNYLVTISPTLVAIADLTNGRTTTMYGGSVAITSSSSDAAYGLNAATLTFGNASISIAVDSTLGPRLLTQATDGIVRLTLNGETGVADIIQLDIGGTMAINSSRAASFTALALGAFTDVEAELNSLQSQINSLNTALAGKANVVHSHSTISITGTFGGGVAAHTHTGSVS